MSLSTKFAFFCAALLSLCAHSTITIGEVKYAGSGCRPGTASAVFSPDNTSLSILFDEYYVEAGGESGPRVMRKSCNIAIPISIPQGISIAMVRVDYRGFNAIPKGAFASFSAEFFFAGSKGRRHEKRFDARDKPILEQYFIREETPVESVVWSRCGKDINMRINTSAKARTNREGEAVYTALDTMDLHAGLKYHLAYKRCPEHTR